jgi:hypothetical protein
MAEELGVALQKVGFDYFIAGHAHGVHDEGSHAALPNGVAFALQLVHAR